MNIESPQIIGIPAFSAHISDILLFPEFAIGMAITKFKDTRVR